MIKNVRAPYGEVGKLESSWHPLVLDADGRTLDPEEDEDCAIDLPEIDTPTVLRRVDSCFYPRCAIESRQVESKATIKLEGTASFPPFD